MNPLREFARTKPTREKGRRGCAKVMRKNRNEMGLFEGDAHATSTTASSEQSSTCEHPGKSPHPLNAQPSPSLRQGEMSPLIFLPENALLAPAA